MLYQLADLRYFLFWHFRSDKCKCSVVSQARIASKPKLFGGGPSPETKQLQISAASADLSSALRTEMPSASTVKSEIVDTVANEKEQQKNENRAPRSMVTFMEHHNQGIVKICCTSITPQFVDVEKYDTTKMGPFREGEDGIVIKPVSESDLYKDTAYVKTPDDMASSDGLALKNLTPTRVDAMSSTVVDGDFNADNHSESSDETDIEDSVLPARLPTKRKTKKRRKRPSKVLAQELLEHCFLCDQQFNVLKVGQKKLFAIWPFICNDCEIAYKSRGNINCKFCLSSTFSTLKDLKIHIRAICRPSWASVSDSAKKYLHVCTFCQRLFLSKKCCEKHLRVHTMSQEEKTERKEKLTCGICDKAFAQNVSYKSHMARHMGLSGAQCDVCQKTFPSAVTMRIHKRKVHAVKKYQCQYCSKIYKQLEQLRIHEMDHTGEKPFACTLCEKRFKNSHQRKNHMMIHRGETPYVCVYCGKGFTKQSNMRDHERAVHTGEMSYFCQFCNKGFLRKDYCLRHEGGCRQKP